MPIDFTGNSAEDFENYFWTTQLITNSYRIDPADGKYKLQAHLLVGEWVKKLEDAGDYAHVKYRGGEGYVEKAALGKEKVLEVYFIDVGQGDSILINTPDDKRILIDGGGNNNAYSFLKWKYNLAENEKDLEAVILTHADSDHVAGLVPILNDKNVFVRKIYHNGIARFKNGKLGKTEKKKGENCLVELYNDVEELQPKYEELDTVFKPWVDAVKVARERGEQRKNIELECSRVDQSAGTIQIGGLEGVKIRFIGPINVGDEASPYLRFFTDERLTINGNSVAIVLEYGAVKMLLCGDMNGLAEKLMLEKFKDVDLEAAVFKANHHGSPDFTTDFLSSVKPWITVVSSGGTNEYGHPRADLLGSIGHYAPIEVTRPLLFSTQLSATFKEISEKKKERKTRQKYERRLFGMINVRTNGKWVAAGRVYKSIRQKTDAGKPTRSLMSWEIYALDMATKKPLLNNLKDKKL